MLLKNIAGFTLVEIVITIVIIGIIAGMAALIIAEGARAYSDGQSRGDVHYQARYAVEWMAREALKIRSCADIVLPQNPSATLSFTDVSGTPVAFSVGGVTLSRGLDLLANGVTSSQPFRYLDQSGNQTTSCLPPNDIWFVEIDFAVSQGSESLNIRTRVHPRNFQ